MDSPQSRVETFNQYRRLLFSIAYRMLGSAMEAEDMVQEAYLRYEKAADIQSPKAYLTTIITRLCLDHLKSAKAKREEYIGSWLPEPLLTSPDTIIGDYETISMAFLVLLESLSPLERAIFVLREIFDYSYDEIAEIVSKNEANCRQLYHRARQYLVERRPRFEPSSADQKKLVQGFLQAVSTGDIAGLTQILAEDIVLTGDGGGKAPAIKQPMVGREAVIRMFINLYRIFPEGMRIETTEANGTVSLMFLMDDKLNFVMNFRVVDNHITAIYNILNPDKLAYVEQQRQANSE